ncbi:hypothetical protein K470DRAFT_270597 [Piedraia hortae CBS 480.64]|uniref:E3 ubiquitin ligase complex SCF subunit n=1 Tax=Piedraia hortae CBS 480.64 TaxID=1314780 RepID=A0A6A7BZQ0_9PEZI|nr:hypothetical protein K470DRAFT_270597 [Piedraia hortae CBS 480.64]
MSAQESPVTLVSSDGVESVTTRKAAECSLVFKNLFADFGVTSEPLLISKVEGAVLRKVIEWYERHQGEPLHPDPAGKSSLAMRYTPYQMSDSDIPGLMNVGCKAAALAFKDMPSDEIRAMLGIDMNISREDEANLLREFAWAL